MTMHLCPVFVTTTRYKSKSKSKTAKSDTHDKWLLKKGLHPDQIKKKKVPDKHWKARYAEDLKVDRSNYQSFGMGEGVASKPEPKVYSGELTLLGIATMHKSNMVPVFAKKDAEDISRMRR